MHKKLKLIFLLILLPSFESHGQINPLSLMGIDADKIPSQGSDAVAPSRELEMHKKEINEEFEREKLKDNNYGYSGGENFNN